MTAAPRDRTSNGTPFDPGLQLPKSLTPGSVLSLVVGHAMRLVGSGVAIGLGLSLMVTRSLARLLFDVGPRDLSVYTIAPAEEGMIPY